MQPKSKLFTADPNSKADLRPARASGINPDSNPEIWKLDIEGGTSACNPTFTSYNLGLSQLLAGNQNFLAAATTPGSVQAQDVTAMNTDQNPWAVVVSCADSRVAPEALYDQTLGNIFVLRNAGNVIDPLTTGSIEYAVGALGVQVVLFLSHDNCGAVAAAAKQWANPSLPAPCGSMGSFVNSIINTTLIPNQTALAGLLTNPLDPTLLRQAAMLNAQSQAYAVLEESPIIINNGAQVLWAHVNMYGVTGAQATGQIVGFGNGVTFPYPPSGYNGPSQTRNG